MLNRGRVLVGPGYLFACLILGGSAQGVWQNLLLQLAGILIIAWAAGAEQAAPLSRPAKQLLLIGIAAIIVVVLQLIPLPPAVWLHLGPRTRIGDGFRLLGMPLPSEPLSLTPDLGLSSMFGIIPPLAIYCAMVRLKAYRPNWMSMALVAGTVAGVALGALQVISVNPLNSPLYLYDDTNWGRAVGFFANADHMATLLVITIPFLTAIIAAAKTTSMQHYSALIAVVAGIAVIILIGLALNGSLAGYGLAIPVIAASALLLLPDISRLRFWIIGLVVLLALGAITTLETTGIGSGKFGQHATSATQSRAELFDTTSRATKDFMPFGSGLGSFRNVYALYENPVDVNDTYVVHAHDDYLELTLELGLAGIVVIILFLVWWASAVWHAWFMKAPAPFARAAAIASAAVLIHSLVDFPLRTASIAASFALCLALLVDTPTQQPKNREELRRVRNVLIR